MDERTPAETQLLDVVNQPNASRQRFARAANDALAEAVRAGYSLDFSEEDGLRLRTPSGLLLWFAPGDENGGIELRVIDERDNPFAAQA